jgi:hypothetical protein
MRKLVSKALTNQMAHFTILAFKILTLWLFYVDVMLASCKLEISDAARCVDVNHRPVGNPKRKVWWVQQQAFPSVRNQGLIVSRKKPNSRRWCLLASWQLQTIYKVPRLVLCFASCNAEPAHNTTKYFVPNLRWGCQSHRFAVNKGMSVSSGKQ